MGLLLSAPRGHTQHDRDHVVLGDYENELAEAPPGRIDVLPASPLGSGARPTRGNRNRKEAALDGQIDVHPEEFADPGFGYDLSPSQLPLFR